ncbi:hypothetical protein SCLCIDRAFT_1166396 [Scleroderma citrinum Foug A]|uniref:Retrotransposon gag domain-containing protein n=1 Tax=Scleroderma citrinum Foug A TaxID=1036808 RepID=A0A0C2YPR0_9AGAM|nr:hypothetical protein SCLCIDRAFT_1166396 [Scleroderma citrinum Foug A]
MKESVSKHQLRPKQERTMQEAINQLTKDQQRKIYERQRVISVTGVKKPGTKSTSSRGKGLLNLKGKGPDLCIWGALSVCENELNLQVQHKALASWKVAQVLAQSKQGSKTALSAKGEEVLSSRDSSPRAPSSRGGSTQKPSPEGRPAMVLPPKVEKAAKIKEHKSHREREDKRKHTRPRALDPVCVIVDKAIAQDKSRHKWHKTPRAMEPVEQVNRKSYIGLAFKRLGRKDKWAHQLSSDSSSSSLSDKSLSSSSKSSSSSSSSSSESTDSSTETEGSMSDSDESSSKSNDHLMPSGHHSPENEPRSRRNEGEMEEKSPDYTKKSWSKGCKSHRQMKLKPILPMEYNRSINSKAFHCFITEGTAYVKDREVPSKKQAFILSHYLTGKAHEFYVHEVSGDLYRWRLSTFFHELFNYCFPVDYRIKLRKKLHLCYQGNKTVQDYLYELNKIWNMIGEMDECTKVHKLWFSLCKEIQHDLWRDRLNLEISSLRSVIACAEIIKIMQSVTGGGPKLKNK